MKVEVFGETHFLRRSFAISRGSKSKIEVVKVEIRRKSRVGMGECVPYARYQQDVLSTMEDIHEIVDKCEDDLNRERLNAEFPPSSARNALDCALWHLESREAKAPVWRIAELPEPKPVPGVYSLSLAIPEIVAFAAKKKKKFPILKLKVGNSYVVDCVSAVREVCPNHRIILDANEAWDIKSLESYIPELTDLGVEMIEQPLHADADHELEGFDCGIALCADESFHTGADLERLHDRYDIFNIKLDKTGGLTEAISTAEQIRNAGKKIMIGSMMCTSYSLAPAMLLAHDAAYVDLDSGRWLREDHPAGVRFKKGTLYPAELALWK